MMQLFGVWIGISKLESLDVEESIDFVKTLDHQSAEGGDHGKVTQTQALLSDPFFKNVRAEIEQLTKEYVSIQGHDVEQIQIASSWGNILSSGEPIHAHSHANSYVSGSFYLTSGSPIHFHNPLTVESLFTFSPNVQFDQHNQMTWRTMYLEPQPGQIIMFPSKLKHHVEKNTSDYRYSIAFNTLPIGNFGHITKQINIKSLE